MGQDKWIVDGYQFSSMDEYERAKKERETIAYLMANTEMSDMKALLKIYNRSIEKKSFQTIIGQQFLFNQRRRLIGSQIVGEDTLAPIVIAPQTTNMTVREDKNAASQVARYQKKYEDALAGRKVKNLLIGILLIVIVGMVVITLRSKYSVFTYFTDYKTNIRNEVINEMEDWQKELETKEKELDQREDMLKTP